MLLVCFVVFNNLKRGFHLEISINLYVYTSIGYSLRTACLYTSDVHVSPASRVVSLSKNINPS